MTNDKDGAALLRADVTYLATCALSHADKFPVPAHMRSLSNRILAALKSHGQAFDAALLDRAELAWQRFFYPAADNFDGLTGDKIPSVDLEVADCLRLVLASAGRHVVTPKFDVPALPEAPASVVGREITTKPVAVGETAAGVTQAPASVEPVAFLPKTIGRLHLGERSASNERLCNDGHPIPDGHPLYWPQQMGEHDDNDPSCLAHAIVQAESDAGWCATCLDREQRADAALAALPPVKQSGEG